MEIPKRTQEEELHQKQIENLMNIYPDALGSFKMNLTGDYITDQNRFYSFVTSQGDRLTIEKYIEGLEDSLSKEDFKKYKKIFSRQNLIDTYNNGDQQISLTHQFKFTDRGRWIKTSARILANPVTKELEAYVFAVDITETVLNNQMINKLINSRYDVIALIHPDNGFVDFRYSANEFKGSPETAITDYEENRLISARQYGEQMEEYIRSTELDTIVKQLDDEGKYNFTMCRMLEGSKTYKRYSYNYLSDDHEIIIATVQDITSLIEKEDAQVRAVQEALAEAERANAAKTAFLSNMSHDIRTPMNAIINMAKMAEEDIDDRERALDDLKKIQISSKFLLSLINDVLDMARIDSGKVEFQPTVYEYRDFLDYIDSVFTPLCKNKDIEFIWHRGDTDFPIYVDVLRFNQLFFNLLSNAVKYTPPGGTVVYDVHNHKVEDGNLICDFIISDTGRGMSREFQKRMFSPFERETDNADQQQGTGLGLAIVKSTVDMMGGTIKVDSQMGRGTTFTINLRLPIATAEQIENHNRQFSTVENVSLTDRRILVADDQSINREIMRRLLERKGVIVDMAVDGQACLDAFNGKKEFYYDAILMDVRMPVLDGLEATQKIRRLDRRDAETIPIIAMTANAFAQDRLLAEKAGMSAYLSKPIDEQELYRTLTSAIAP